MSEVSIRGFAQRDLEAVVALWNRCLTADLVTEERFWYNVLLDPNLNLDGTLIAEHGGRIVGYMQAIVRRLPVGTRGLDPETGWITAFFVDPDCRRRGVARALLDRALSFLRAQGRKVVSVNGYSPYYFFPGVDPDHYPNGVTFLQARGFKKVAEAVAMGMSLEGVSMPENVKQRRAALAAQGYEVRPFRRSDTLPLLRFAEQHFPGGWHMSLITGLSQGNADVIVATRGDEIVGYTQWQNPYNDPPHGAPGRFGPFGVRPDLRNLGIGAVIFYTLVEHVRGQGAKYLWFGWGGGRNFTFYERAGCQVLRRYDVLRMDLG